ncbi:MAG: hypothetical protein KDB74_02120, partial [Flavobacteriales bacterium]|nr:hypothetical protein [Flavobacteriales bacterium]
IRFDIAGSELFRMQAPGRINFSSQHVYIGNNAGTADNTTPHIYESNVGIGIEANRNNIGGSNVAIGAVAMGQSTYAGSNVAVGNKAMFGNMTGSGNTAVGQQSMFFNTSGGSNVAIGQEALNTNKTGSRNVTLGGGAIFTDTSGNNNVAIGHQSGLINYGSSNIFIGYQSAATQTNLSNKLFIENSSSTTPLIYGNFADDSLKIHGILTLDSAKDGSGYTFPGLRGTNGQVLTSNGAGKTVWEDAEASPWNTTGSSINYTIGKVGIGTASPETDLHVKGSLSLEGVSRSVIYNSTLATRNILVIRADTALNNGAGINLYGTNDNNYSDQIRFFTQNTFNTPNMLIDSSGKVAIGTESPSAKLTLAGTGEVAARINSYASALSENASLAFSKARGTEGSEAAVVQNDIVGQVTAFAHDGTTYGAIAKISIEMDAATGTGDLPGRIQFHTTADGASTTTERMRIDSDGNVGIGKTDPSYKLDVLGEIRGQAGIGFYNAAEWDHIKFSHTGSLAYMDVGGTADGLAFRTENTSVDYNPTYTERMRIDGSGNVGIGNSTISSKLDVAGDIETGSGDAFYFGDPTTNGTWRIIRDGNDLSFERREGGTWVFKMKINE